ncbi:MAG TPA: hypothetical protein VGO11_27780 [Chthoniobacteraceae bacterium]|jgi:OOP family OmpA-OmpF porin|nr:hypothetical protein [Chthoniobacteraceae bacterium]
MTAPGPAPEPAASPLPGGLKDGYVEEKLVQAMTPLTERTIRHSIELNPGILTETLFPIIGGIVRRSIAHALEKMIQALNETVEHSLSPQSIRWRLEAKRTGKTLAEIVLIRTLVYRVEQVFLIEKKSGLLLQHVAVDPAMSENSQAISAMLTAIQDFMRDAFRTQEKEIGSVTIDDATIWIESGPDAVLAAEIRGNPPQQYRDVIHETVAAIHQDHLKALARHETKPESFRSCAELMKGCLQEQRQEKRPKKKGLTPFHCVAAVVAGLLLWWAGFTIWNHHRWGRLEEAMRSRPGIVVMQTRVDGSHFHVQGMRDPLADDPVEMARQLHLPEAKLHLTLGAFHSLDDDIVRRRGDP